MTDDEARHVLDLICSYLREKTGTAFDTASPDQICNFFTFIEQEWTVHQAKCGALDASGHLTEEQKLEALAEQKLEVLSTAGMILLGPESLCSVPVEGRLDQNLRTGYQGARTIPPADLREALMKIMRGHSLERLIEALIWFGCGEGRKVERDGGWRDRWPGAIRAMVRLMRKPVEEADLWLRHNVEGYEWALTHQRGAAVVQVQLERDRRERIDSSARTLATRIADPEFARPLDKGKCLEVGDLAWPTPDRPSASERFVVVDKQDQLIKAFPTFEKAQKKAAENEAHWSVRDSAPEPPAAGGLLGDCFRTQVVVGGRDDPGHLEPGCKWVWRMGEGSKPARVEYTNKNGRQKCDLPPGTQAAVLAEDEVAYVFLTRPAGSATAKGPAGGGQPPGRIEIRTGQKMTINGPCTVAIYACTCGNKNCREKHRLSGWTLASVSKSSKKTIHLWGFVATAIKGAPATRNRGRPGTNGGAVLAADGEVALPMATGSIVQGMYGAMLLNDHAQGVAGRLRLVPLLAEEDGGRRNGLVGALLSPLERVKRAYQLDAQRQQACNVGQGCPNCKQLITPPRWCSYCEGHRDAVQELGHTLSYEPTTVWVRQHALQRGPRPNDESRSRDAP
jgi:hypothetical protein